MFGIFGLGDGKMDLQLKNVNVVPGDTLEGTASLTMKKDVMGKEVVAILYAEETVTERKRTVGRFVNKSPFIQSQRHWTLRSFTQMQIAHINTNSPLLYQKPVRAQRNTLVYQ